jgi:hypothetical protein
LKAPRSVSHLILIASIALLSIPRARPQDGLLYEEISAFRPFQWMEVYVDRADMSLRESEWWRIAGAGVDAVMAEWESEVLLILAEAAEADGGSPAPAFDIGQWVEDRFAGWITEAAFERLEPYDLTQLRNAARSAGGDAQDEQWRESVSREAEELLSLWRDRALAVHAEILPLISPERTETVGRAVEARFADYETAYRRELDKLLSLWETRLLGAGRSRASPDEMRATDAARILAGLIRDAEINGASPFGAFPKAGLPEDMAYLPSTPTIWDRSPAFLGDNEAILSLLQSELDKWDRAEQQLLESRTRWETAAAQSLAAGSSEWDRAVARLEEEQRRWQERALLLIDEQRREWSARSDELAAALLASLRELETALHEGHTSLLEELDRAAAFPSRPWS